MVCSRMFMVADRLFMPESDGVLVFVGTDRESRSEAVDELVDQMVMGGVDVVQVGSDTDVDLATRVLQELAHGDRTGMALVVDDPEWLGTSVVLSALVAAAMANGTLVRVLSCRDATLDAHPELTDCSAMRVRFVDGLSSSY